MKRLLPLIAVLSFACVLQAQTTIGPESTNNNRNQPAIAIQPQGSPPQSNAPQGPPVPGTTPAASTPAASGTGQATGTSPQTPAKNAPPATSPANPNAQDAAP